eukprot:TRINITY_DN105093_c0_g1_i1.p1 TRINITY_DN105093_c0_g1~~TRINITY_DN105093_c0_g1_i1.p1  ORF type:complete len:342 (+),score=47.10 TRINITY_DN105093_c0_g1_i1:57-1082(+)
MEGYDHLFKVLLIGDSGVGKSAVLLRFTEDAFTEHYHTTIGVDFNVKTLVSDGKRVKLQIWDTASQERFRAITTSYYRGAHGIIVVYSIDSKDSFENVSTWLQEIENASSGDACKLLLANKADLSSSRVVSTEDGQYLADSYSIPFLEVSAKTSSNISEAFCDLTSCIKDKIDPGPKLAVTLTGDRTGKCISITCFSVAGEELATLAIDSDDSMTWAKLRPLLLDALHRKGQRIQFISSSGSMLSLSDKEKLVTEILELAPVGKDDRNDNANRITNLFQGCGVELGRQELSSLLHTLSGESLHVVEAQVKTLFEAFMRARGTNADKVLASDFLSWIFEVLR